MRRRAANVSGVFAHERREIRVEAPAQPRLLHGRLLPQRTERTLGTDGSSAALRDGKNRQSDQRTCCGEAMRGTGDAAVGTKKVTRDAEDDHVGGRVVSETASCSIEAL